MNPIVRIPAANLFAAAIVVAVAACGQQPAVPPADVSAPAATTPATAPPLAYPGDMFEYRALAQLPSRGNCAIDRINKQPVGAMPYAIDDELLFGGWFAPPKGVTSQRPLLVLDDGSRQFAHVFLTGGEREDVAAQLQRPELAKAGFNVRVTLEGLAAGDYALWLVQEGAGGFRCNTRKSITVTG